MGAIIHYNPSTGAVSYDSVTGAVHVSYGETCESCAITASDTLRVTLAGVTFANECYDCSGGLQDINWAGMSDLNDDYDLTRTANPCWWKLSGSYSATRTRYNSTNWTCSGLNLTTVFDGAELLLIRGITNVSLICRLKKGTSDGPVFFEASYTPTAGCVTKSGVANTASATGCSSSGWGGTASIIEVI